MPADIRSYENQIGLCGNGVFRVSGVVIERQHRRFRRPGTGFMAAYERGACAEGEEVFRMRRIQGYNAAVGS